MASSPRKRKILVGTLCVGLTMAAIFVVTKRTPFGISDDLRAVLALLCVSAATMAPNVLEKWMGGCGNSALVGGYNPATMRRVLGVVCAIAGAILTAAVRPRVSTEPLWFTIVFGGVGLGLLGYVVGDTIIPEFIRFRNSGGS